MNKRSFGVRLLGPCLALIGCGGQESTAILHQDDDGGGALHCDRSEDCQRFGSTATCVAAVCKSQGISCAERARLSPTAPSKLASLPTTAAVLDEWLLATTRLTDGYCSQLVGCGDPRGGPPCTEGLPDLLNGTCCAVAADFYVENRDALKGCPAAPSCNDLSWATYCPSLAAVTFETMCK